MIKLENITKIYEIKDNNKVNALSNVNLEIGDKGLVFILGKSGSGKSTLLNILGGLDKQTSGNYIVNGKSTTDFKDIDYDSFRNTSVGFIFQEFNVLEKYNVYENIALAYELQNEKSNREEILKLLEELGIKDLENRKMNELSGGQKQRVAIARALIKKPQIILADEPTGNLDSMSSAQIFQILKSISKERLVIVVSHDRESAKNYADRTIGIKDGQIEYDNGVTYNSESNNLELKKSKLPFKYAFKMAIKNLKNKPSKLSLSILVIAMSFMFLATGINFSLFKELPLIMQTMKNNNLNTYKVQKIEQVGYDNFNFLDLQEEDYKNIEEITSSKLNKIYNFYENGLLVRLNIEFAKEDEDRPINIDSTIIDVEDDRILNNIIGRKPSSSNEAVIYKELADDIIKYGIILESGESYYPKDYNDLVSSNIEIKYGDNKLYIVGIVDGDYIYTKGLADNIILNQDYDKILNNLRLYPNKLYSSTYNNSSSVGNINYLDNEIDIMTSDGIKKISELKENEVIVSSEALRELYKDFDNKFIDYYDNVSDYNDSLIEFSVKYLEDMDLYKNIQLRLFFMSDGPNEYDLHIVGISYDNNNYISSKYKEKLKYKEKEVNSVLIYDDNYSNIKKSFSNLNFFNDDSYRNSIDKKYSYSLEDDISEDISGTITIYNHFGIPILVISMVFFALGFSLFSNFITLSISNSKKEIGVLRGLGASSNDVAKIFGLESIIIGFLSSFISIILWVIFNKLIAYFIIESKSHNFNPIVLSPVVIILIFVFAIAISILISSSNTRKISKQKPIDAILDK